MLIKFRLHKTTQIFPVESTKGVSVTSQYFHHINPNSYLTHLSQNLISGLSDEYGLWVSMNSVLSEIS